MWEHQSNQKVQVGKNCCKKQGIQNEMEDIIPLSSLFKPVLVGYNFYPFWHHYKRSHCKNWINIQVNKNQHEKQRTLQKGLALYHLTPNTNLLISATLIQVTFLPFWYFYQTNHHWNAGTSKQSKSTVNKNIAWTTQWKGCINTFNLLLLTC